MGTSLLGAGESAQIIQEEVLKQTSARAEDWKDIAATIKDIKNMMEKMGYKIDLPTPPARTG